MRIAIVGCGGRMSGVYHLLRSVCPDARLVGVLDPDEAGVRSRVPADERDSVRFFPDLATLMCEARPDAVMVGTRCDLHATYGAQLAAYGLPVFLEKPVATSLADALALERAWGARHDQVVVSFPLRVSPLVKQAARWLAEPANGRISHVNAVNYVTYGANYFTQWYRDHAITQGLFLQKATHDFDYLAHLVGAPITRVAAMALHGRVHQDVSTRHGNGEADVLYHEHIGRPDSGMNEDCSSALIEFANGIHGTYSQVFFAREAAGERGVRLSGQRSTIGFDWYSERIRRHWHHAAPSDELHLPASGGHAGGDEALAANLVALIRGEAPSAAPLQAGLESVYACLAAKQSAAQGRFINVHRWGMTTAS